MKKADLPKRETKRPAALGKQARGWRTSVAPFLAWPVSRRAFYRAILISLVPSLAWGVVLFGVRPLMMLVASLLAASLTHFALKKSRWKRAQGLLLFHSLVSVCIMVALAHPTWPAWPVAAIALLLPLLFALLGGPGKEPLHLAVVFAVLIQFAILPALAGRSYAGKGDALLAQDRLFMGDIRDQSPPVPGKVWPSSRELGGDDAFPATPPAQTAAETLDAISHLLPTDTPANSHSELSKTEINTIAEELDKRFAFDLPSADYFAWGITPGRIGEVSLIAIALAGLHLSYRYILRPRSVLMFMIAFTLGTAAVAFTPETLHRTSPLLLWDLIRHFPGQMMTLFQFLVLGSDAFFAAVFILALPGTEPLTPRGRRIFLVIAAFAAAGLHRYYPTLPVTTFCLTAMMPVAPLFDKLFKHRSWLNSK